MSNTTQRPLPNGNWLGSREVGNAYHETIELFARVIILAPRVIPTRVNLLRSARTITYSLAPSHKRTILPHMKLIRTQSELKTYISDQCEIKDDHSIYTGPPFVMYDGRRQRTARVYWQLVYGPIPERSWLLKRCTEPNCIEPDCWALSSAPAVFVPYVASAAPKSRTHALDALKAAHAKLGAAIEALELELE